MNYQISKSIYDNDDNTLALMYDVWTTPKQTNQLNVFQFKILEWYQHGIYLVVKINYPNAKHYEGNKVLVYENITINDLKLLNAIDPHFSENKQNPSPIARFEASLEGWINALKFCSMLHSERLEVSY